MSKFDNSKTFDPILDDYAFFETHSTEAENDLRAYAAHLTEINKENGRIRMLDFGSGTGSFTSAFLGQTGWLPGNLELWLIEPGEKSREQALKTLVPFTTQPILHFPALPPNLSVGFELILTNHVLYYVSDLAQTIEQLSGHLNPGGRWLNSMAGMENTLIQCWAAGFGLIGETIPYHTAEDFQAVLDQMKLSYQRESVAFTIVFPDSIENRLKILRFLFGKQLTDIPQAPLLQFFDPYLEAGEIRIDTQHYLYVVWV